MAKDVLITPLDGIIQFSSSAGAGTGQIKVDSDDLVISNLVGDVLLGDGASDVFIGAALGYFTSKTLLRLHNNKKGRHFTIYPRADSRGGGIVLSKNF